jgi:multiple sugar transport system substrate-binding protein
MAVLPATPFVGGSDLVVWKQSRQAKTAIDLVRYLTSPDVQKNVIASKGMLPARLEALDAPPFTTDPYYQVIRKSLKTGRGFHATYMWGLIEDKLAIAVGKLWTKLLAHPEQNEEEIITQHLNPLVKELNHTLSS